MKSKFITGKKLSISSKMNIKHKIDDFLVDQYEHLQAKKQLMPSKNGSFFNCGARDTNDMIMDYIRNLYDQYSLPDPMTKKHYKNDRKMIQESHIRSNVTETPMKKPVFPRRDSIQTHKRGGSVIQYTHNPNARSQVTRHVNRNSTGFFLPSKETMQPIQRNENPENQFQFSRKINSEVLIKESYRYCIGCEDAVLTGNMKNHERTCVQYQRIFGMQLPEILNYLQQKIDQITNRSRRSTMKLAQNDTNHIRMLTESICEESLKINKSGRLTQKFVSNYNEAIDIGKKWSQTSEEINKLRWFLKIRQQIKNRFDY